MKLSYMEDDLWGAPLHHCRVALRTAAGWFVTTEPEIGEGTTGASSERETRFCEVGPSGAPSCTPEIPAGCVREDGQATHELHFDGSVLELAETNDPPDGFDCELERTRSQVVFP